MKHKQKQKMIRFWPFESWQAEQAQVWLEDMAMKGWRLDYIGLWAAHFKKAEPAAVRYRCALRSNYESFEDEEKLKETYIQAGWKYIDDTWRLLIYCDEGNAEAQEVPKDWVRFAKITRNAAINQCLLLLGVLVLVSFILYVLIWDMWGWVTVLLQRNIFCLASTSFLLLALYLLIRKALWLRSNHFHIQNEIPDNEMRLGLMGKHGAGIRKAMLVLAAIAVVFLIIPVPARLLPRQIIPPPKEPVTLTLADIINVDTLLQTGEVYKYNDNFGDFSLLFPKQHITTQDIGFKDSYQMDSDIVCESYHSVLPWFAQRLAETTAYEFLMRDEKVSTNPYGFDLYWAHQSDDLNAILAVKGSDVYHIAYWGSVAPNDLAKALAAKIDKQSK